MIDLYESAYVHQIGDILTEFLDDAIHIESFPTEDQLMEFLDINQDMDFQHLYGVLEEDDSVMLIADDLVFD
jgi:hypothetical protein